MSQLQPTASGSLEATPLSHLLVYVLDRRLTGTLVLEDPGGAKSAIFFWGGAPNKVKTAEPVAYLGRVLVGLHAIDEPNYARTLEQALKSRTLHGQLLVAQGLLDAATLKQGLREQMTQQVEWLFRLPKQSAYGYYDNANFLQNWGGSDAPRAKPLALLWRAVRLHADPARVQQVCDWLGLTPLRLHRDAPISKFGFSRTEQAIVDVLRAKPQPLGELLGRDLLDGALVRRMVFLLSITRQFDTGPAGGQPLLVEDDPPSSTRVIPAEPLGRGVLPDLRHNAAVQSTPPLRPSVPSSQPPRPSPVPERASRAPDRTTPDPARGSRPPRSSTPAPRLTPAPPSGQGRSTPPNRPSTAGRLTPTNRPSTAGRLTPTNPGPSGSRPPAPRTPIPPNVDPESPEGQFRREVHHRAMAKGQSYYDVLGVPKDATVSQIQGAFFQLAKKWHPDRLGPEFADIRADATRVFTRMTEAHQLLTDARRRKEYDEMLAAGGGSADEQEKVALVLRAATAFQKAEVYFKKGNLEGAEREARLAAEADPDQAEYGAFLAWVESHKPGCTEFDGFLKTLSEAVRREPNNERIRWYRGQIYKRVGQDGRAANDFRQILELNPKHTEAAREIRLHDMRRTSSRPPTPSKGIGKWFKR